jgi:outer membrane protein assembly factor BamB
LANLVVIEDGAVWQQRGVDRQEIERIVAPGGVVCEKQNGQWTKSVKPRPGAMDDWPQPSHGPDGNRVSADQLVQVPVGLRWLDGVPMNFNLWAACRGWVLADGRCFTLSTTELENLAPVPFAKHRQQEYLMARDAFNGLPLWKVNCETSNDGQALNAWNIAPLVTDGKCVYAYKKDRLTAFDAATGREVRSFAVKYPTVRLVLAQGVLLASGWEAREVMHETDRGDLWSYWTPKTNVGAVEAFDAADGNLKWSLPTPAQELLVADGLAYALIQSGNPAKEQQLAAFDVQTGGERWRIPHPQFSPQPDLHLNLAGQGVLVIARTKAKAISILSAADGKTLWEIQPTTSFWTPLVDGLLWQGNTKYDPRTGEVRGKLPAGVDSPICTPSAVVGPYVTASRGCSYLEFTAAEEGKPQSAKRLSWAAARGGCIGGSVPANGLFYTSQNNCRCSPGQVPGFVAYGPNGELPTAADFEKPRPVERGPAFGAAEPLPVSGGDWPAFRHDAQRSGAAAGTVPDSVKLRWQTEVAKPSTGPLADAWKARLTSCLSEPVVAGGLVFAAATDAGQVVALEAASGKIVWQATVGGRLDSPPAIHGGLCLFGCHDGWLYALRAKDGQLAWRTRLAPWERRMVAFGQVESVWPAPGAVLVEDGAVYATAGRTTESDGGLAVCALDSSTGEQIWAKVISPGPARQNDVLSLRDGKLRLHHVTVDAKSGECQVGGPDKGAGLEGLTDGTWTRIGTRRSGNLPFGRVYAELLAWNDATVFGYTSGGRSYFSLAREKTVGTEKLKPDEYAWRASLPPGYQAEAMACCQNAVLMAGSVFDAGANRVTGFLLAVSTADGRRVWEQRLDAPAAFSGLAVANEAVFVTLEDGTICCFGTR